jgi:hypothetical protein
MKLKLLAASAVLAAGLGASYALADDGNHGRGENHDPTCQSCQGTSSLTAKDVELHVRSTTHMATTQPATTQTATASGKETTKGHGHRGHHQGDDD